jgi:hypothetical protein
MNIKPKTLFLIDGLGAILSALMLGVVLVHFQDLIGMPIRALYVLAFLPCLFMIYSFSCFFFLRDNWSPYLKFIAIVNFLYCLLSIGMMIVHRESLTVIGYIYFIVEIIIVLVIAGIEYRASKKW